MSLKQSYIYILSNKTNSVLYTGVCDNLVSRVYKHRTKFYPNSFTAKYNVEKLVYYEISEDIEVAIKREKQIKGGSRADKVKLITSINPEFKDLYEELIS